MLPVQFCPIWLTYKFHECSHSTLLASSSPAAEMCLAFNGSNFRWMIFASVSSANTSAKCFTCGEPLKTTQPWTQETKTKQTYKVNFQVRASADDGPTRIWRKPLYFGERNPLGHHPQVFSHESPARARLTEVRDASAARIGVEKKVR